MWQCWRTLLVLGFAAAVGLSASNAKAQTFGIELHNNLMPASGGMAGASLSRPQDLQSGINGNPATLRQFQGTQFSFGGAWADANYHVSQADPLPLLGVTPFSAKSGAFCPTSSAPAAPTRTTLVRAAAAIPRSSRDVRMGPPCSRVLSANKHGWRPSGSRPTSISLAGRRQPRG